jgi:phage shock protein A
MALLERVSTLLRANLNDLVEKAEDPERLLKQIVLDMENQLMQVKTQVAIAIADEHLLGKKRVEHLEQAAEWRRKAELAVQKGHDQLVAGFTTQAEDQKHEADNLRQALRKLDQKLSETRAHCEMLVAEHRRAKVVGRATEARQIVGNQQEHALGRMQSKVRIKAAENAAASEVLNPESLEDRFQALESEDKVDMLLKEIKSRQAAQ